MGLGLTCGELCASLRFWIWASCKYEVLHQLA